MLDIQNFLATQQPRNGRFFTIAIDGRGGCGKSTLAEPHITEKNVQVTKGFCLERCYSFKFDLDWDIKIWVETPKEVCLERGKAREKMPIEKILPAWNLWQQQEDEYIRNLQPHKKADMVIDGMKSFEEQL